MSSSEDEDKDDDQTSRRVDHLLSPYKSEYDVNCPDFVKEDLRRQTKSCMICIERVKKTEPIWLCRSCRTPYHLHCVQRWARESSSRCFSTDADDDAEGYGPKKEMVPWCCPKCRCEYEPKNIPTEYRCFCGQVFNPKPDPWLVPHSCGGVCRRDLRCGHQCVILCHPGFCPPCPKMVRVKCFCGKSDAQMKRCYDSKWSCQKTCNKKLACGIHRCSKICHEGDCHVCTEVFVRKCRCGKKSDERPCSEISWSCDAVCDRSLPCGRHKCASSCHEGVCSPCVEGRRTCPCGKTEYEEGNCIDDLQCCGDTCGKLLDCNLHNCTDRCHRGPCSSCNQRKTKRCRCGLKEKEFVCGKEFLCEIKCKQKRQCGRHACNRRCCDGACPPCEQTCGRSLQCGNHKCPQPCHRGPCFPCVLMSEIKCRCGKTVVKVPCGHERMIKPPRCRNLCQIPPVCRHKEREHHRCHYGDCPPCRQVCLENYKKCDHKCQSLCHTGLLVDVNSIKTHKASTPWEKLKPKFELVNVPCPPCQHPVPVTCLGNHETGSFHCFESKPYSCGRQCGRILSCGNHKCAILCHDVDSQDCQTCEELCRLQKPNGCTHQCPKPCHPAPCPPCRQMVRQSCHCNLNQKFIPCLEWAAADDTKRQQLLSCGNQCPKMMTCSHRCTYLCHKDNCSSPKDCSKKSTVRCPCGRRTSKGICSQVQSGQFIITCDSDCAKIKADAAAESASKSTKPTVDESSPMVDQSANQIRRRRKNRKRYDTDDDESESGWKSYLKKPYLIMILIVLLFIFVLGLILGYF